MRYPTWATGFSLAVALGLCFTTTPLAATYYVANNGHDSNPGSSSLPWRTLQKAANTVRASDVVLAANGTYAGFQVTADGTEGAPIVFRANGSNVVINAPNASTPDHINIEGGNYVTVEGFVVNDAPRVGIRVVTATGVVIRNNTISRSGLDGILTGYTPQIQIIGNTASGSVQEHGIYMSNSTSANDNPIVRDNECFDNHQNGMQFNGDCDAGGDGIISGAVIENNVIHHNQWKGFSLISLQGSTIRNNVVYENGLAAGAGGLHLADQPGCGHPSSNNVIANNTIYEPRIACIRMTNGSTANTIFNNLLIASTQAYTIADEVGGNYIDTVSNRKLTSLSGLFVGAGLGDFHLLPTSPVIDDGVMSYRSIAAPAVDADGAQRPHGPTPDAGAYEHGSATGIGDSPAFDATLEQNVPNPFGASTRIAFTVPSDHDARVALDVFDVRGARVRNLVRSERASGRVEVAWDGRDDHGRKVASGVYLVRLATDVGYVTRRMTVLR